MLKKITINYLLLVIFFLALFVRGSILYKTHHGYFGAGILVTAAEMAHQINAGNGFTINPAFTTLIGKEQYKRQKLVDFEEFKQKRLKPESLSINYHNLPGYSLLLALTYQIFGQEKYIYLQVIQIIFDALAVFLIFSLSYQLFSSKKI